MDIKKKLEEPLRRICSESGKSLREVSISLKKMIKPSTCDIHVSNSQSACKALFTLLKSGILNDVKPLQMVSLMTTVSMLIDIVNLTEKISESVHELASAARFKNKMRPTMLFEKLDSDSNSHDMPKKSYEHDHNDVDTTKNVDQSHGESSMDSCNHVTIKIVDDDSVHDEDGGIHLHTSVSSGQTNAIGPK